MTQLDEDLEGDSFLMGKINSNLHSAVRLRERVRLLRDPLVLRVEEQLAALVARFGVSLFFHRPTYDQMANEAFLFESPVAVPGFSTSSIEVCSGYLYWPTPLLADAPYHLFHELGHLIAGRQPPTRDAEDWKTAAFELNLVLWVQKKLDFAHNAINLPPRPPPQRSFLEPVTADGWRTWRIVTAAHASEGPIVDRATARRTVLHNGHLFTKIGTPKRFRDFPVHPYVVTMRNTLRRWRSE